jgi:peptide/nickel transport system permease protein
VIALPSGLPLGVYAALRRGSFGSQVVMTLSLLGVSLPTFLIGILLILFFSVCSSGCPASAAATRWRVRQLDHGLLTVDGWKHLMLPAITLSVFQLALILRLVRAEMLEVLRTDYVKFARARGLPDRAVYFGHALKNTLVPVITITGLQLGSLIAFAIITETVFQWPGMGLPVHPGGAVRRHPGDGGLSVPDRADLRGREPDRGPAVLRRRPALRLEKSATGH